MPREVRTTIATGIRVEMAAMALPLSNTPSGREMALRMLSDAEVRSEPHLAARWDREPFEVWVGFPANVDHAHQFTVAKLGRRLFKLGGFTAPELTTFDQALGPHKNQPLRRAVLLASLADDNGADRLTVTDSVHIPLPSGESVVELKLKTYQPNAYAPGYHAWAYTFLFSSAGALVEWSRTSLDP